MCIVHTQVLRVRDVMLRLFAVSSPCVLYNFKMIILGLERVVCLAGQYLQDCCPAVVADSAR